LLVGHGKLIDSAKLAHVFISPTQRAKQTFELAFSDEDQKELQEAEKVMTTPRLGIGGMGCMKVS